MPNWIKCARTNEIPEGQMCSVDVGNMQVCLSQVDGTFYAIANLCTHAEGYLADGTLMGTIVECPLHGAQFDVTTGAVKRFPASESVRTYPVKREGNDIFIDVE